MSFKEDSAIPTRQKLHMPGSHYFHLPSCVFVLRTAENRPVDKTRGPSREDDNDEEEEEEKQQRQLRLRVGGAKNGNTTIINYSKILLF